MGDDYNREAFLTAFRATSVPTFHEARAILSEISDQRIGDPDVAKYVEFCKDLTNYCIEHGIQRSSGLNPWSVLAGADKEKLARTLVGRWFRRRVTGPIMSAVEGGWLAVRLRGWTRLQAELLARYQ